MKILWVSNSPHVSTGYGGQTRTFAYRLQETLGHEVTILAFWGLQGAPVTMGGITVLPAGRGKYSNDVIVADAERIKADIVITLMDVWVLDKEVVKNIRWCPWLPIDHSPVPPDVLEVTKLAFQPIAYSKFGQQELLNENVIASYVPHGVDTSVFYPVGKAEARKRMGIGEDKYLVSMVAANIGSPSRKAFDQQIRAFAKLHARHPNTMLYIHTDWTGKAGDNIERIIKLAGIPKTAVARPDLYKYERGLITEEDMRFVYSASDVLLNVSRGEGFGVPIIESMACGTPVIATDFTAMSELVPRGTGWLVPITEDDLIFYQDSYQAYPPVGKISDRLEVAYTRRGDESMSQQCRDFILDHYDANEITRTQWRTTLDYISGETQKDKALDEVVTRKIQ
jgi:glycosyltransferase involved in cell wall biosynthesis